MESESYSHSPNTHPSPTLPSDFSKPRACDERRIVLLKRCEVERGYGSLATVTCTVDYCTNSESYFVLVSESLRHMHTYGCDRTHRTMRKPVSKQQVFVISTLHDAENSLKGSKGEEKNGNQCFPLLHERMESLL